MAQTTTPQPARAQRVTRQRTHWVVVERLVTPQFILSCALLVCVCLIGVAAIALSAQIDSTEHFNQVRDMIEFIFPSLMTLTGSSFAWYFARRAEQSADPRPDRKP